MITIKKMTEMKEKIYPTLPTIRESPTAPAIELTEMGNDQGHTYRLKEISDAQKVLEEEISKREAFSKKYFRVATRNPVIFAKSMIPEGLKGDHLDFSHSPN